MTLREDLRPILERLLALSDVGRVVTLDVISETIGVTAVSADDVNALVESLEEQGRTVGPPSAPGPAAADLKRVVPVARTLSAQYGRTPSFTEIALASGLPVARVRDALAFAALIARTAR